MKKRFAIVLIVALVLGGMIGFLLLSNPTQENQKNPVQEASYLFISQTERIAKSEAIFVGKVLSVSTPQWNQDSGERWEPIASENSPRHTMPLLFHTLTVEITTPIVDTINLGQMVTITVLGNGPKDVALPDDPIKEGDPGIFYIARNSIAWRESGTHEVLYFMGSPSDSYVVQGSDGLFYHPLYPNEKGRTLENILQEITGIRKTLVQP